MSTDYSFYATLCGFMPRPEGVQKGKDSHLSLFLYSIREREPGLLVKIVHKIGAVFDYWSKIVHKCGCLPYFLLVFELEILVYK